MLRGFTGRIVDGQPDSWTTHVAGHPPGALLVFVWLDRLGLGGGVPAAAACILVGTLAVVAVPVTLRALGAGAAARAAVPVLALSPGAVWVGVSADGLFTGVTAGGLALLAVAATGRGRWRRVLLGGGAGTVLAAGCFLSYGLVLVAPLAVVVAGAGARAAQRPCGAGARAAQRPCGAGARAAQRPCGATRLPIAPLLAAVVAGVAVVAVVTAAGFWWPDGYHAVVERYHQGIARHRPYRYWVWANLAALLVAAGPLAAAVVGRAVVACRRRWPSPPIEAVLTLAAVVAILAADVSGLSKAEVERIWLPFAVWLPAGAGLLRPGVDPRRTDTDPRRVGTDPRRVGTDPRRVGTRPPTARRPRQPWTGRGSGWLLAQAGTALAINHLVLTTW